MHTGNPTLNDKTFENFGVYRRDLTAEQSPAGTMTINATGQKTMFLLLLAMGSTCFTWSKTFTGLEANPAAAMLWAFGGAIIGLITGFVICFKHTWATALAPVYALAEGLFLGGVSASFEAQCPGIVIQSVSRCPQLRQGMSVRDSGRADFGVAPAGRSWPRQPEYEEGVRYTI